MDWQSWFTLGVTCLILLLLMFTSMGADLVLVGGLTALFTAGIITPHQALGGFANEGMITVAAMFVVAAGIRETDAFGFLASRVLGRPTSVPMAQARLSIPCATLSAFMNNTPIVAMLLPVVADWARRNQLPVSKLMMPLSFATILGGLCTLIGTSTNLVVAGLWSAQYKDNPLGFFEIGMVGVPCAVVGIAYMIVAGRWLLPERGSVITEHQDPRQYTVEMIVEEGSRLVGQTVERAQLRHLPGLYLLEIDREGEVLPAVSPREHLCANDRLVFVGLVESVVDLQKIRGLKPASDHLFRLDAPRGERCLIEAVVSDTCPAVGRSIREGRFRAHYQAAVVAVARNGERLRQKIGDIVLKPGDTLLLETEPSFLEEQRNSRDFYLVSRIDNYTPPRHDRWWLAVVVLTAVVALATFEVLTMVNAALLGAILMIASGCCSATTAHQSINWSVLLVIAASFGIGEAMMTTGLAKSVAASLVGRAGSDPYIALIILYAMTMIMTELLSNNAAAALMFPFAIATANTLTVDPRAMVMAITIAASCGFATPIGYQTNLMVYGPGGYRFHDYLRFGIPLNLIVMAVTVTLAPLLWKF